MFKVGSMLGRRSAGFRCGSTDVIKSAVKATILLHLLGWDITIAAPWIAFQHGFGRKTSDNAFEGALQHKR